MYSLDTVDRYLPGGDIYSTLSSQYGEDAAYRVAEVAGNTADPVAVNQVLAEIKNGPPLETSTISLFSSQMATNFTAAPASYFNDQLKKIFANLFKNPWLLIAIIAALFFLFGGASLIRSRISKA